jgi:hypothetical protein
VFSDIKHLIAEAIETMTPEMLKSFLPLKGVIFFLCVCPQFSFFMAFVWLLSVVIKV